LVLAQRAAWVIPINKRLANSTLFKPFHFRKGRELAAVKYTQFLDPKLGIFRSGTPLIADKYLDQGIVE
jgi:hypothetical protein